MRGRRSGVVVEFVVEFVEGQRGELEKLVRSRSVKASLQQRCRAVLAIAGGMTFRQAAEVIGMTDKHLRRWCRRFQEHGIDGLKDRPGRGRKPTFSPGGRC